MSFSCKKVSFAHYSCIKWKGAKTQSDLKELWSEGEHPLNSEQGLLPEPQDTRNCFLQFPLTHAHITPPHVHKWTCMCRHTQVINPTKWSGTHLHRDVSTRIADSIRGAASRCLSAGKTVHLWALEATSRQHHFRVFYSGSGELRSGPFVLLSQVVSVGKRVLL